MLHHCFRIAPLSLLVAVQLTSLSSCKTSNHEDLGQASLNQNASGIDSSIGAHKAEGRYFGFVRVAPGRKISTILDVVEAPRFEQANGQNSGQVSGHGTHELRGIMRFFAGDFMSDEYTTMYFQKITVDPVTSAVVAIGTDDRFVMESANLKDQYLDGVLSFAKAGISGDFKLRKQRSPDEGTMESLSIFPEAIAAQRFTGNYYGKCEDKEMTLQIEAARWSGGFGAAGILDGLRVAGRFGLFDKYLCGSSDKSCIHAHFRSGDLNFITGAVNLRGYPINKSCVQDGVDLVCEACRLSPTVEAFAGDLNPPQDFQVFRRSLGRIPVSNFSAGGASTSPDVSGQYFGYLHHETNDRYQLFGLNVMGDSTGPTANGTSADIYAVASIYFGGSRSPEFVAHRFEKTSYARGEKITFDGPGGGFLVVEDWRSDMLKGVWYSKNAGRIGTVELSKAGAPELPATASVFRELSGAYEGDQWQFELSVSASVSESPRDYYPLRVFGWAKEKIPTARRRMIEDGSFDFYSNSLAFRLDDGRMAVGRMTQTGVELFWPPISNVGTPMERQGVKSYVAPNTGAATVSSSNLVEPKEIKASSRSNSL